MSRIGVVVLAAGRSSRFAGGQASKLLALVGGVPIVRRAVDAALDAGVGEVVVVTGDRSDEVAATLEGVQPRVVREPRFADGMATSLRRGVAEVGDADAVMIALGDVPDVRPMAYRRVMARWQASGAAIVVPRYAGSPAPSHPALFAATLFGDLQALEGDVGARSVIARHASLVAEEPLEWPAPRDVDTLQDLDAYLNSERSR
jgi:molybdenum cofactor cytidylyltransferase